MKTSHIFALAALVFASRALQAADTDKSVERAKRLNEQFTQPPRVSTGAVRTPEQAIREYKASGKAPGVSLKIKPVPSPGR